MEFFILPVKTFSFSFCTEPSEPYCVNVFSTFRSSYDFEACKSEVQLYIAHINEYIECLNKHVNDKNSEAKAVIRNFNDMVQRTNNQRSFDE